MPRYSCYTAEQKNTACEDYLSGVRSVSRICIDLGMSSKNRMTIYQWAAKYKIWGNEAFLSLLKNKSYTKEFKMRAVEDYPDQINTIADKS